MERGALYFIQILSVREPGTQAIGISAVKNCLLTVDLLLYSTYNMEIDSISTKVNKGLVSSFKKK